MFAEPKTLAEFNAWANSRLHAACAELDAAELKRDRGAFFDSILGTLNHILLVDILYRERLEGRSTQFTSLDQILHADLADLTVAQQAEDAYYIDHMSMLAPADFERPIGFETLMDAPEYWEVPRSVYFTNLFQHQVHHRGQTHNMVSQAGLEPPPIGFIEYMVEQGLRPVSNG
ncbi:MAG: DinB family protein [Alphaproteobacteria bacterium]|jgi:uncharacterized damage-inducible protein DinB|nr:DinB family protein [Alphaproteobacteria bacterium]